MNFINENINKRRENNEIHIVLVKVVYYYIAYIYSVFLVTNRKDLWEKMNLLVDIVI